MSSSFYFKEFLTLNSHWFTIFKEWLAKYIGPVLFFCWTPNLQACTHRRTDGLTNYSGLGWVTYGSSRLCVISWLLLCVQIYLPPLNTSTSSCIQIQALKRYQSSDTTCESPYSRLWAQKWCDSSLPQLLTYPLTIWQCKSTIFFYSSITLD